MLTIPQIGIMRTPYPEKFAVPRQPSLVGAARGRIIFHPPYGDPRAFAGLEGFSHLMVIFGFDRIAYDHFKATVRPPRLGGNTRVGVFASRSPYRPSRLGLSILPLVGIEVVRDAVELLVQGPDLTDGTPIYDIKPYLPFVDAIPEAKSGFAPAPPVHCQVTVAPEAAAAFQALPLSLQELILEVMAQDPRPAYRHGGDEHDYGALIGNYNVRFAPSGEGLEITALELREGSQSRRENEILSGSGRREE